MERKNRRKKTFWSSNNDSIQRLPMKTDMDKSLMPAKNKKQGGFHPGAQ